VVPNPGFEQGGCGGTTLVLCGWSSDFALSQDTTDPHTGNASMHLECGTCYYDPDTGIAWMSATTGCVRIGPGVHTASFWYRDAVADQISLDARFFYDPACTNEIPSDSLAQGSPAGVGWQQVSGTLRAPIYTQSALISISLSGACATSCQLSANVDDVEIDDPGDQTPLVDSFTPASSWFGRTVELDGSYFVGATSVSFNGTPAQFTVQSDGIIDTTVPSGATSGPIAVTTANGTGWSSTAFALVPPPTISSFTPTGGPFGTVVDIQGSHLSGAHSVSFNGVEAASFTVDSDTEIHATVAYATTTGPIYVETASGTAASPSSFTVPTPTISSFTPTSGPPGTSVDIRGTNFTGATRVSFNNDAAAFTVDSDSEIHATVPAGGRSGQISVTTNAGLGWSSSPFSVQGGAPTITSFTPTGGPVGTSVDIRGDNLTGATSVTIDTLAAAFTVDSTSEIHATVPDGAMNGYISIVTPLGTVTEGALFIVTTLPPSIALVTPTSGPVGTNVVIYGGNLSDPTSVTIGGKPAPFTVESDSTLHLTVPADATHGPISITTPLGSTTAPFTVITPAPTINSFAPTSGPVGTTVEIQGTNLTGATSVTFNGTADPTFVVNSATDITAHVPGAATTGPISVTTPGGTATSSSSFTLIPSPTITGFSPTSGHAGQQVTITGANLAGTTRVKLGAASATFTVNSSTTITATVPSSSQGYHKWSVTTPGGTATSSSSFHLT
jgi:hypothetical protein